MLFDFDMIDMNMIVEMNPFCDSTDQFNNLCGLVSRNSEKTIA